jgi:hypothetical protein
MTKGKILQDDEDFLVEVIDWHGQPAVKKTIQPTAHPARLGRFSNEGYGLGYFADLADNNPHLHLHVPEILEVGQNYIIIEYIDADRIITKEMHTDQAIERIAKLAELLAGIDHVEPYGETKWFGNSDVRNIRQNFTKWLERPLAKKLVTQSQIDRVDQIMDELTPYVKPRIAQGDLSPHDHVFLLPDDSIALIDFEAFTPSAARYYDVAKVYTRLFSFEASLEVPMRFLKSFLAFADPVEYQSEQLRAIILARTIGMQRDSLVDHEKGIDYRHRAKHLLDLALQSDLSLLYS